LVKWQPNVSDVDPDVNMPYVFMLGEGLARMWAKKQVRAKGPFYHYNSSL
jgi:hypothetical protein